MAILSAKALAGPGYIILNAIRVMNIIALLAVICASMVMIVKTAMDSQFFFFDAVSHVITAFTATFLTITEIGLFHRYFTRNWPLFSLCHGFTTLGLTMLVLGVDTLGNLNKPATSQDSLGLAFWRIVIGSGILITILGFFNIICSFLFCDRANGVTARQVRAKGAVAIAEAEVPQYDSSKYKSFAYGSDVSSNANSTPRFDPGPPPKAPTANVIGVTDFASSQPQQQRMPAPPPVPVTPERQREPSRRSFRFTRFGLPVLPSYKDAASPIAPSSKYSGDDQSVKEAPMRGRDISGPMNVNPQFAHLIKPNNAYHPSARGYI